LRLHLPHLTSACSGIAHASLLDSFFFLPFALLRISVSDILNLVFAICGSSRLLFLLFGLVLSECLDKSSAQPPRKKRGAGP
jgi:hypothetical protein